MHKRSQTSIQPTNSQISKMTYDTESYISLLPTEVLLVIFALLTARDLTACRRVCSRWKMIVDGMSRSDHLWRLHCRKDFRNIYKVARVKARPGVLWFHIYRSLSLWSKLAQAREQQDEFAAASGITEEIQNFKILRDGIIGVHKKGAIVYYDIGTLEKSKRTSISGDYLRYTENDDYIIILGYQLHLFIIRKAIENPKYETNVTFDNVKSFILAKNKVYYVTLRDEMYVCPLENGGLREKFITDSLGGVMCLGYTDNLHVLTFERKIYTIVNDKHPHFTCSIDSDSNLLQQLREYNFLERMDWRVYIQWMYVLNHTIPEGPLRDIVVVRTYGDIVFVGSNWGVLRIYYAPYSSDGEFDLFNAEPVKQYNFMERYDCPVLSMCPIIQIDVTEGEAGHTVIVAMPKKIALLEFTHSFKRTAAVAMLPYSDAQKVKALKIDDN